MRIRLVKPYRNHREGYVYDMPDGVANLLVRRGIAVEDSAVEHIPDETIREATDEPAPERAVAPRQKAKKR